MKSFYKVIDSIKEAVNAEPFNSNVSYGSIDEIDLNKQSLFPLAHIEINNAEINENFVTFNVTLYLMDLVDFSKDADTTLFLGNDNQQDVENTQFALATRVMRVLKKADLYRNKFELQGAVNAQRLPSFENKLSGWEVNFQVGVADEMTYC